MPNRCYLEDLLRKIVDRDCCWEKVKGIHAVGKPWCWLVKYCSNMASHWLLAIATHSFLMGAWPFPIKKHFFFFHVKSFLLILNLSPFINNTNSSQLIPYQPSECQFNPTIKFKGWKPYPGYQNFRNSIVFQILKNRSFFEN